MESLAELVQVVEAQHDCAATFVQSVPVREAFDGQTVWEGIVHIFKITGHPKTTKCYAWSSPVESSSKRRFYAVLEIPPVQSAQDAVRAAIVAEQRK